MSIRCKKCGTSLNKHCELRIDNDPNGYWCKGCGTLHLWTTGQPVGISKPVFRKYALGSITKQEVNRK